MYRTRNINIQKHGQSSDPDIVYYNCDIINGKTIDEGAGTDPQTKFSETRNTSIIHDASKYYFSIVRFNMNGANKELPILIPTIETGQSDINKTIYKISVKLDVGFNDNTFGGNYTTLEATQNIQFIPQTKQLKLPNTPLIKQDIGSTYYYVYQYKHFVDMFNATMEDIKLSLEAQYLTFINNATGNNPPAKYAMFKTEMPTLEYNPSTERFELLFDNWGFDSLGQPRSQYANPMIVSDQLGELGSLYFDSNLWGLLANFPNVYNGGDLAEANVLNNAYYTYEVLARQSPSGDNIVRKYDKTGTAIPDKYYYKVEQDYKSTTTLWCPVGSIVFTSTLIPIQNEENGEPLEYGQSNAISNIGTQSAFTPIITDIALQNTSAHDYREYLSYVPSAEYRLATMSNSPVDVRSIDIQVFWKHRLTGELFPLYLYNQSSVSVKMMFRKRTFNIKD